MFFLLRYVLAFVHCSWSVMNLCICCAFSSHVCWVCTLFAFKCDCLLHFCILGVFFALTASSSFAVFFPLCNGLDFVVFFMCILVLECDFFCVSGFGMCVCLMLLYCVFCISKVLLLL